VYDPHLKILILFVSDGFLMEFVNALLPMESSKTISNRKKLYGVRITFFASIFGAITPSVPVLQFLSLLVLCKEGIHLGVTFGFLILRL